MENKFLINYFNKLTPTYHVLNIDGKLENNYISSLNKDQIINAYYFMQLSRKLDNKMIQMQRQGRLLTFPPNIGEEALQVAVAFGMDKNDYFVPAFRSAATFLALGVKIENILLLWNGNERGNKFNDNLKIIPFNIPIGTQYSHANGIGYGLKYKNLKNVAVSFIGDGGTSEGEFYEAINFANVMGSQTIFCINNNQWAISTPTYKETKNTDLATKAIAVGMPYIKVDGNDFFASFEVFKIARDFVLKNKKPILVEFVTYRQGPHTTSDNPKIYRSEKIEEEGIKLDPIDRYVKYLLNNKLLSNEEILKINEKIDLEIKNAIDVMERNKEVLIDEIFDYTYDKLDENLIEQKEECKKIFNKK